MIAYLRDNSIYLDLVTPDIDDALAKYFSAFDQRSVFSSQYELGYWDGRVVKYSRKNKRLSIGFLEELKVFCKKNDYPLDIEDQRGPRKYDLLPIEQINKDMLAKITLDDYQIEAIKSTYVHDIGIHYHSTGSGKTEMIVGIVASRPNCPTVIIAEEKIVLKQIVERLELRCIVEDVGKFYAGKKPNGQTVIVGSIQSLRLPSEKERMLEIKRTGEDKAWRTRKKNATILREAIKKCYMVIVDECDRAVSDSYGELFDKLAINARYRYGFSGTPFDDSKPVKNLILKERLGTIISSTNKDDIQAMGRIIPIDYFMFTVDENGDKYDKTMNDAAIKDLMIGNSALHERIRKICSFFSSEGTLVLVDNIELGMKLKEVIPGSDFISGTSSDTKRKAVLKAFENRELKVLIGSKILRRGLDLKGGCENLILCYDGKMKSEFMQRIGRAVRVNKKGKAKVFDFMIMSNYYLYSHAKARLKYIDEAGYSATVIYKGNVKIPAKDLIKRRWRFPK